MDKRERDRLIARLDQYAGQPFAYSKLTDDDLKRVTELVEKASGRIVTSDPEKASLLGVDFDQLPLSEVEELVTLLKKAHPEH